VRGVLRITGCRENKKKPAIRNYKKRKEFNGMCKSRPFALLLLAKKELPTCYTI